MSILQGYEKITMHCRSFLLLNYCKRSRLLTALGVVCLLGFSLIGAPVIAGPEQDRQILRVGYAEFPPFTYQSNRGQAAGKFIDITRQVIEEAGYNSEFIMLPPSRLLLHLRTGLVDVSPHLSRTPSMIYETLESWVSPTSVYIRAWRLKSTESLTDFNQLRHMRIIVIAGYNYGGLTSWMSQQSGFSLTEAPDRRAAIDMLKRNRGDYLLAYSKPIEELLLPEDANIISTMISSRDGVWLFALNNPQAAVLRDQFDDAYIRLVEKGEVPPLRRPFSAYKIPGFPEL